MASTNTPPQILLTGATGYIGGTMLTQLLNSSSPVLKDATISCLLRGQDRAATLTAAYGSRVRPILYRDFDDIEATVAAAAQHDLVINTTIGFDAAPGTALVRGLAQRKAATGRDVWMIYTSGVSNLGDRPLSKGPENLEFDDAKDDVYGWEKAREASEGPYVQRTAELAVVDAGLALGVKTLVVTCPAVFGLGTGLFHRVSFQIPMMLRSALATGRAIVVGDGSNVWDIVHVQDLAALYVIVARRILEDGGAGVPSGKKGIIFASNGRRSALQTVQRTADACYAEGKLAAPKVEFLGLAEATKALPLPAEWRDEHLVEMAFASNSRTVSSVARSLGWKPTRGDEAWEAGFRDDLKVILEKST
ncbi:NAD dependent epimerase/dehydratase family protein [Hypoxylon cercidicola]|nr:NAD dependent epimerase/dehydratase family protein [Hypoxylon cercidicola]